MGEKETTRSVGAGQATEILEREGAGGPDESARASNLNLSKSNINREAGSGDGTVAGDQPPR